MLTHDRRQALKLLASGSASALAIPSASAQQPPLRIRPRIKGLSMTTYSMKPHMRWWWGKETEGKLEIADFLEYAAQQGLDGVELTSYFFKDPVVNSDLHEIKRRAYLLGLNITGGAMGNNFSHPPESDVTKEQMAYFQKWVDHFATLGAPAVRVFASRGRPKGASDEQVIDNVIANLKEALVYAESKGVLLGLENHDFVTQIDYLLQILEAIDSPWLGVTWDSANLAPTDDPYRDLARIAPYAITAQIKVMTKVNGEHTPADFGRLVKILQDAKFSGPLVLEYEEKEDPYQGIPRFIKAVREVL